MSPIGSGAILILSTVPDAPVLTYNIQSTTKTQILVQWTNGAYNGGQTIIDYRISYD